MLEEEEGTAAAVAVGLCGVKIGAIENAGLAEDAEGDALLTGVVQDTIIKIVVKAATMAIVPPFHPSPFIILVLHLEDKPLYYNYTNTIHRHLLQFNSIEMHPA